MKYEVLNIKKRFRYHATVMATPNRWWEKIFTTKLVELSHYTGVKGYWLDNENKPAKRAIAKELDSYFDFKFESNGRILQHIFTIIFSAAALNFLSGKKPGNRKPETGN